MGNEKAKENPGCRIALVGETAADARKVMVEGESGILAISPPDLCRTTPRLTDKLLGLTAQ
jgi:phage terminase large subunit-like protein